ncbi:VCBS repeat-containing protein [Salipiger pacificus]|nr:VCBS repeat-containing protein [Alloyangia pacifica]MCA0943479.1 VCBS repeat-containing protein [Alloyangia pacifica]
MSLSLGAARAETPPAASYAEPTTRYDHGVLGDAVEWGALRLEGPDGPVFLRLPQTRVFEDIAPRVLPLPEGGWAALVVESDLSKGARLALYTHDGLLAATDFIGQAHRWVAPLGGADLDGDGALELAYVDRPHLSKTLRVVRYRRGDPQLREVAAQPGLTNHRIGWDHIAGGLRDCGGGPEILLADGDFSRLIAARLVAGRLDLRDLGPWSQARSKAALRCD